MLSIWINMGMLGDATFKNTIPTMKTAVFFMVVEYTKYPLVN